MMKKAKSIAEYAVRSWLEEHFDMRYLKLTVEDNEAMVEDEVGNTLRLVYNNDTQSVYIYIYQGLRGWRAMTWLRAGQKTDPDGWSRQESGN